MSNNNSDKVIVIGGSAGSLPVLLYILQNLPQGFPFIIIVVLHRLKNSISELGKIINTSKSGLKLREPDDKEPICMGHVYIAPANYHLLAEEDKTFSLDYSEPVLYSRPSIDVAMESFAAVYGPNITGILLSGANEDGAVGLGHVIAKGGIAIVQAPDTAEYPVMPAAGQRKNADALIFTPSQILQYLDNSNIQ
jgi:two-component system chemotaxis response regulator CheB